MSTEKIKADLEAAMALAQQLRELRTVVGKRQRTVLEGWIAKWVVLLTRINRRSTDDDEDKPTLNGPRG